MMAEFEGTLLESEALSVISTQTFGRPLTASVDRCAEIRGVRNYSRGRRKGVGRQSEGVWALFKHQALASEGVWALFKHQALASEGVWALFKHQALASEGVWALFKHQALASEGVWALFKHQALASEGMWALFKHQALVYHILQGAGKRCRQCEWGMWALSCVQ